MPIWKVATLVVAVGVVASLGAVVADDVVNTPAEGSVDVGFLQDMIAHHEQAIQLGAIGAETATDPTTRHFAQEALISQQYEVGYMTAILESWGYGTGKADRDAMGWMGARVALDQMPGMLKPEQLSTFRRMSGDAANLGFLSLMSEHHRGGLHMARYAARHASDERVRSLAAAMLLNQEAELAEYARAADKLGVRL